MSFGRFLQQKQLSSHIENLLRARFKEQNEHLFLSSQILPVHDVRLQMQSSLIALEMNAAPANVYRSCANLLHKRVDEPVALEESLDQQNYADLQRKRMALRHFVLNVIGALLDSRFYDSLRTQFGGVYIYVDNNAFIENIMALRNVRDQRDQAVLLLHFCCNTSPTSQQEAIASESSDAHLLHSALNRRRFRAAQASRKSLDWLRSAWQQTKHALSWRKV